MLQLHLSDRQICCLLRCVFYQRLDGNANYRKICMCVITYWIHQNRRLSSLYYFCLFKLTNAIATTIHTKKVWTSYYWNRHYHLFHTPPGDWFDVTLFIHKQITVTLAWEIEILHSQQLEIAIVIYIFLKNKPGTWRPMTTSPWSMAYLDFRCRHQQSIIQSCQNDVRLTWIQFGLCKFNTIPTPTKFYSNNWTKSLKTNVLFGCMVPIMASTHF